MKTQLECNDQQRAREKKIIICATTTPNASVLQRKNTLPGNEDYREV